MAEATRAIGAASKDEPLSPEEVLSALTGLLGLNFLKETTSNQNPIQKNTPHEWSLIPWEPSGDGNLTSSSEADDNEEEDNEIPDVNFSSFPSLSLERRSLEEQLDSDSSFGNRDDVEAHVSSLLSRPILVSNVDNPSELSNSEDDNEGEMIEGNFMAANVSEVPTMMMQNIFDSFSTLLNSRLRAHATFLARHGLALLDTSSSDEENAEIEEGFVGVEQKLETMLEIGRLISTNAIVTSFEAQTEQATTVNQEEESGDEEETTIQVAMPLTMDASIDISLPRPGGGQSEVITVSFQTTGSITGMFSSASKTSPLLRAVEVDLDMDELLPSMIMQASNVITSIVVMTNQLYSLALPAAFDQVQAHALEDANMESAPPSPVVDAPTVVEPDVAIVSPSLRPKMTKKRVHPCMPEMLIDLKQAEHVNADDDCSLLSPESCESLVDFVLDSKILSGTAIGDPSAKRAKY